MYTNRKVYTKIIYLLYIVSLNLTVKSKYISITVLYMFCQEFKICRYIYVFLSKETYRTQGCFFFWGYVLNCTIKLCSNLRRVLWLFCIILCSFHCYNHFSTFTSFFLCVSLFNSHSQTLHTTFIYFDYTIFLTFYVVN